MFNYEELYRCIGCEINFAIDYEDPVNPYCPCCGDNLDVVDITEKSE